jgi:methionyl-tRNA synthetase
MTKNISLTTTLPYVNADPHIGFALEIVQADAYARYQRLMGNSVFFNTGTDEHGIKIYRKAQEQNEDPQVYVNRYAQRFDDLKEKLNLSYDAFIRTTDEKHIASAQEFWKRCEARGDIYKKNYSVKYCVGCELEKMESELDENGQCPLHPGKDLEIIEEENYFFRFSKYQEPLLKLYAERPDFVVPTHRLNEIRAFVERGLQDFSISRVKEKMPWGVPVPGDDTQVMYVWFDALVNYISTLNWPDEAYSAWWPSVQFAGKDNLRQQSAMWQAMLMSAGIEPSKQIMIHGFITSGGQKMSKSLGNVVNPIELVAEYGTDALRYFLLRHINPFEDSDFTHERFHESYTAHLVNGLGNLTSRVMKLAETHLGAPIDRPAPVPFPKEYADAIERCAFNEAMDYIWDRIGKADERMATEEPYKVVKTDPEKAKQTIAELVLEVYTIGRLLQAFMPETSDAIKKTVLANKKPEALFPRIVRGE